MQRSAAIRKIEQDMIQLGQLYQEVAELIHQQEPAVTQINQGAEETHTYVQQANTKLDTAITSARNARRWKWYALIIVGTYQVLFLSHVGSADPLSRHHCHRRRCGRRCHRQQQQRALSSLLISLLLFCTARSDSTRVVDSYPYRPFSRQPLAPPRFYTTPRMSYLLSCVKAMFARFCSLFYFMVVYSVCANHATVMMTVWLVLRDAVPLCARSRAVAHGCIY